MFKLPEVLPVFPLPTVVFFPRTYLPLHIFEPRYRQMVKDCMKGSQTVAMALLKEGWEEDYYDQPQIYPIGCVGKVVKCQPLDEGRYNLLLYGLLRVSFEEYFFDKSYRQAKIKPLPVSQKQGGCLPDSLREMLFEQIKDYSDLVGGRARIESILREDLDDEVFVNLFSAEMDFTVIEKQFLLEASDVLQRAKRLIELVGFRIDEVRRGRATG